MSQKVAYVTGGMGGIGTAICQRLSKEGFKVIAGCGPTRDYGKWLAEQAAWASRFTRRQATWATGTARSKPLTRPTPSTASLTCWSTTRHHPRPHVPQNDPRRLGRGDRDQPQLHVQRHQASGGDMVEKGWGRIINISSVNGVKGQAGQTNYSAAKAGMHGFSMALAQELATKGVTVNTVSPGYIGTDMVKAIRQEVLDKIIGTVPVKRLGEPSEIASIIAWLASDEGGYATGAEFSVNGGLHMG
jgi:acetoacetyl-CoA reductase